MASNADIEMRWIDAWSDLYEIAPQGENPCCVLPDGRLVDVETCKGWLQDSAYQGWLVKVEKGQQNGENVVVASRWR